ncbi:HAD family hydrolase [Streptococcus loxodontisalivarius]|uniref:Cof subfamily protein (Haloacid dehalogenase superfamily) n=1 Tax=Streptococcus loxodontisalivarius TaxID=1349415 RepID=A0ABS2PTT8_9STRE|nr:HAD family hydrolase [Streptococcus loxodontisalivarius]MBM7643467.1 Cof subfamily protein (haloacid dehalogenase superfamily) [Streptococcus loxodontisalivarius]
MNKKMIALDLDGTLLLPDGSLSQTTIDTIKAVQDLGHLVVIATGRPYRMAIDHYRTLNLKTPLISFNGSLTNIPDTKWDFEHSIKLDKKYLLEILKNKEELEMDFIASEYRQNFYITMDRPETIQPQLFGVDKIVESMRLDPQKITRDPNALLMQTRHQDKQLLAQEMKMHFKNELEVDSWGGPLNILECSPKGINKAYALTYLLNALGMSRQDLIAFGDEHNDTEMLALAQTGYAMKNASQTLLPFADKQLNYSNEEDGVAKELQKLFLFK